MPVQNKDLDFFIISEPAWLDEKYSSLAKQVRRPCAASCLRTRCGSRERLPAIHACYMHT